MESVKLLPFCILFITIGAYGDNVIGEDEEIGETKELEDPIPNTEESHKINEGAEFENESPAETRRILNGKNVTPGSRPYMVYLNLTERSAKAKKTRGWLCGGVIVHEQYVLTSAACVEDGDKFYVISGTVEYQSDYYRRNKCVRNQRRVVWKCVPKQYKFSYIDDVKWSANDIAVVKVDRPFRLGELEEGCQFAARVVPYNNISRQLEAVGRKGYILGWGSIRDFREKMYRKYYNDEHDSVEDMKETKPPYTHLQEAKVVLMDKDRCVEQWPNKFKDIILEYMICTKDIEDDMSTICSEKYANCTYVDTRRESTDNQTMKSDLREVIHLHEDPHNYIARRGQGETGGFCEYDHGGPLVVRYRGRDHVVGVISSCRVDTGQTLCHGPFLYTSVFTSRQFLACAIHKDIDDNCRRVFRSGLTYKEWNVNWDDE